MKSDNEKPGKVNPIMEGKADNRIQKEKKDTNRESYPRPTTEDETYNNQPEFLDDQEGDMENTPGGEK
jgi:hypothetical protein